MGENQPSTSGVQGELVGDVVKVATEVPEESRPKSDVNAALAATSPPIGGVSSFAGIHLARPHGVPACYKH
jgi:hypothetical protein